MNPELDPTVVDLLRGSALAPYIDRPVNDILADMGLPPLPDLSAVPPLPEFPPMPVIDIAALARPLTDLASSFGTGVLAPPPGGGPDPMQVFQAVNTALTTAMQLGTSALQAVMTIWQGMGASSAAGKAADAQADSAELASQSTNEKTVLAGAATSVAVGGAELTAIIAKYLTTMVASAPLLATPGGQMFMVAATTEALASATAVVAKTRGELLGHSGNMTQAGKKVAVTGAPKGVDSMQQVMQLLQMVTPLMTMASTGAQSIGQLAAANTSLLAPKPTDGEHDPAAKKDGEPGKAHPGAGGGGVGGGGVGGGGVGPVAAPLSPWPGTRTAGLGAVPGAVGGLGAASSGEAALAGGRSAATTAGSGPAMMPIGAAGAAGAAAGVRGAGDSGDMPNYLVSGQHGDEVVGDIEGVSLPVVGAAEPQSEAPPDKELTL
ncbi:hypothetical protein [Nocardia cyriacigeorgica]|uniref:hypothetical protein n=1 Tax=Nocardia cyriacigeorgica TaxID=135487 RepID=UPI001892E30E|nr:hypothetical protein [Nocardia cyriacigeorgica]MBF6087100.1 hypothetical protein [Nocardia cyriacigeorgica]MBF6092964.1 hypothetical protein [Nocardia cyriacigeorgica]